MKAVVSRKQCKGAAPTTFKTATMQTTHKKILHKEISRRRTFGIISHPDAGKTTLTEKLLLFGGAIQMAGSVKGRKASRHATVDYLPPVPEIQPKFSSTIT